MNKGFMQTFAIILLILSSLLLLSIRFEIFILSGIRDVSFISDKSALRYSVRPESIVIRSGQENSTKLIDKNGLYYMDIYNVLGNALKKKHRIEKINLSEYRAMKDSKSIIMNFDPAIDQRLLYGSLFLQDGTIGEIDTIKEIILPQNNKASIYIQGADLSCYEIKTSIISTLQNFENWSLGSGQSKYYTIGERFPQYTDNDVLISDEVRLSSYVTEPLFDEDSINAILRNIFGSKYDYSNRISETDGSLILNYDYGREIIKVSPEGKVYYKNQTALANSKRTSLTEASSAAMGFLSALTGDRNNYVIEEVKEIKQEDSVGYEFGLSLRENGIRLSLKNDQPPIKIAIVNGKVLSMEGIFRKTTIAVDNNLAFGENAILYLLEQNIDYIRSKEPFETAADLFQKINSVEYAYIYSENYNYIACIKIKIENTTFFFKISDAQVVR